MKFVWQISYPLLMGNYILPKRNFQPKLLNLKKKDSFASMGIKVNLFFLSVKFGTSLLTLLTWGLRKCTKGILNLGGDTGWLAG